MPVKMTIQETLSAPHPIPPPVSVDCDQGCEVDLRTIQACFQDSSGEKKGFVCRKPHRRHRLSAVRNSRREPAVLNLTSTFSPKDRPLGHSQYIAP